MSSLRNGSAAPFRCDNDCGGVWYKWAWPGLGVGSQLCPRASRTTRTLWKGRTHHFVFQYPFLSLPPTTIIPAALPGYLGVIKTTSLLALWNSITMGPTCSLTLSTTCSAVGRQRMDEDKPFLSQHCSPLIQFNLCVYRRSNADDL
jgi:hypothetical protein